MAPAESYEMRDFRQTAKMKYSYVNCNGKAFSGDFGPRLHFIQMTAPYYLLVLSI